MNSNRVITGIFLCLLFFCMHSGHAQQREIDSLKQLIVKFDADKSKSKTKTWSLQDSVKVNLLDELSLQYTDFDPKKSFETASLQLSIATKIDYKKGIVNALNVIGIYYETIGNYDRSFENYNRALEISKASGFNDLTLHTLGNIGIHFIRIGIYSEALKYFHECLKLAEITKIESNILLGCYNNIGVIYSNLGKPEESIKYYQKSLDLQIRQKKLSDIANTYNNIGDLYRDKRQFGLAMSYFLKGLKSAQSNRNYSAEALNYSGIGSVYLNQGNYEKALENHLKAKNIRETIGDGFGMFTSYICLGNIYLKTHNYQEALRYTQTAFDMVKDRNELRGLTEAYRQLSVIHAKLGNFKQAYDNHQLYKKYNDSIFNAENEKKLIEQQMNFDFRQKEELAKQEIEKQKNLRNLMVTGAIALALFSIFFLIQRQRIKTIREQKVYVEGLNELQQELHGREMEAIALHKENENIQLKNELMTLEKDQLAEKLSFNERELASTTVYLFEKNKMLATLKTALDALPKNILSSPEITNVKTAISSNQYLDSDWEKFKQHFEKVHPDFFKELASKHPGLTDYEVRFCAYLHMKLSTKEIAALLNITPESVTKAKMRLNKKLKASDESYDI